jgi:hypothetical protein
MKQFLKLKKMWRSENTFFTRELFVSVVVTYYAPTRRQVRERNGKAYTVD